MKVAFLLAALVGSASALYRQKCASTSDCSGGFCLSGTCRTYKARGEFCNLYRHCDNSLVCKENTCVDNTCEEDFTCDHGYCDPQKKICTPLGERGDECDVTEHCETGLTCQDNACEDLSNFCANDAGCSEGFYCDEGARKCFEISCQFDSDCSDRYYCNDASQECRERPLLGEACGGDPFAPCQDHFRCDSGVCVDPALTLACAKFNGCDECTGYGFERCVWADDSCQPAPGDTTCQGMVGCVSQSDKCASATSTKHGTVQAADAQTTRFDIKFDTCTRDLDCPYMEYCLGGDPRFKNQGLCQLMATAGSTCGGTPSVRCEPGHTCVVDGFYKDHGVCVKDGKKGVTLYRPTTEAVTEAVHDAIHAVADGVFDEAVEAALEGAVVGAVEGVVEGVRAVASGSSDLLYAAQPLYRPSNSFYYAPQSAQSQYFGSNPLMYAGSQPRVYLQPATPYQPNYAGAYGARVQQRGGSLGRYGTRSSPYFG